MRYPNSLRIGHTLACIQLFLLFFGSLQAARWREITPEEFAQEKARVDPEYGAEILFSEAKLEQDITPSGQTTGSFRFYNRMKVFNEQGVEALSQFELVYSRGREIRGVEGRTVKPDGSVIELDRDDIFDKEVVRKGRTNLRATSFAFPNLEPGDIIELQYSQRSGRDAFFVEIGLTSEFPAQRVLRELEPFDYPGIGHKIIWFNIPDENITEKRGGAWKFELTHVPPAADEPFSLPDLHLGPYVILYYFLSEPKPERYWRDRARELYNDGKREMKPSREIEEFVKDRTRGAPTILDKLKMLYVYCQSELTNHDYSYGVYTAQELKDLPENRSSKDTFTRGHGTPEDINNLFGSMARALGLHAEIANTNDIRRMVFTEASTYAFALRDHCAAVEIDGAWNFFNPGSPFLPFESLAWWAAGSHALVADPKKGELAIVPMAGADFSVVNRKGDFSLDESGTLTGRVTMDYAGFSDLDMKEDLASRHTDEEEQAWILHELKQFQPQAKASNFSRTHRGSLKPMRIEYDLEIPEFADVTGKRIFVQPAVFQKSAEPIFTSEKRQGDILYPYPWTENDEISIQIPRDYALEQGSAPKPLELGAIGTYETKLGMTKSNKVKYQRTFANKLRFAEKKYYDSLKGVYSVINQLDQHTLTFKRKEEPDN